MESLSKLRVHEFSSLLGSDKPSPGGGAAAALVASLGCALAEMVSRINQKRKSNPDTAQSVKNTLHLERLRKELDGLITEDARAFEAVSRLWKDKTPELQGVLKNAALVPLSIIEKSAEALGIASSEIERTSKHLLSDIAESGILLFNAAKAARFNVEINLRAIEDQAFNQETRSKLSGLIDGAKIEAKRLEESFEV